MRNDMKTFTYMHMMDLVENPITTSMITVLVWTGKKKKDQSCDEIGSNLTNKLNF